MSRILNSKQHLKMSKQYDQETCDYINSKYKHATATVTGPKLDKTGKDIKIEIGGSDVKYIDTKYFGSLGAKTPYFEVCKLFREGFSNDETWIFCNDVVYKFKTAVLKTWLLENNSRWDKSKRLCHVSSFDGPFITSRGKNALIEKKENIYNSYRGEML